MDTENLLRSKLEEWGVTPENTLWSNFHSHDDGYVTMYALEAREKSFRVYRAFPTDGVAQVSVDVDATAKALFAADRTQLPYDAGERGNFEKWRKPILDELGGDVVLIWADNDDPFFSFVGRTVRVGGDERVVCGQCTETPNGIKVEVDFDRPVSEVLQPPPNASAPKVV